MTLFSELTLSPTLQTNLARNLFVTPTPVQSEAIPPALNGSDIVATAQTGTGKTLAFVLPILQSLITTPVRGIGAVVLSPTRELAIQINEAFNLVGAGTGIRSAAVVGGLNENAQLQQIRKGAQVLIATPGRLTDFLDRKLVTLSSVRIFVLDEADRMLDMGFLPAIQNIMAKVPAERQTLFFSATIEKSVAHLINANTRNPKRITIGPVTQASEQVDLHIYEVEQAQKIALLQFMLQNETGSFLVFARTKHGTDRLAKRLARAGVKAIGIHGDRTQNQRNQALDGFRRGSYRVLVATDVAARGIHVDGIAHVVNFDLPQVPEDFVHRVGRTGRAGARGVASTFASHGERQQVRDIERALKTQLVRQQVPADLPVVPMLEGESAHVSRETRPFAKQPHHRTAPRRRR
ncbi:MAG: DEAD/DEAH box helicase [Bryobacteraceae bacterium]